MPVTLPLDVGAVSVAPFVTVGVERVPLNYVNPDPRVVGGIDANGVISGLNVSLGTITATPTMDSVPITGRAGGATADLLDLFDFSGNLAVRFGASGRLVISRLDAVTATTSDLTDFGHNSTGSPTGGFGSRSLWRLETSSVPDTEAFDITVIWADAANGTRRARTTLAPWGTVRRECIRMEAGSSAPLLGFYGATAVSQIAGTSDVVAGLVSQGLRGASSNPPINIGSGAITCGQITITDANDVVLGTGTGTKFGTATSQKMGFFNAAPVVQQTGASAAGIAAITDANAKAAVTALQTALANLGFVTSPA